MQLDAYRDTQDNSRHPFRCRALNAATGEWHHLRTRAGSIRRFPSLIAACNAGKAIVELVTGRPF